MIAIVLYVLGGLVGLLVVMALIGLTLRPDHLAARQADIPRPPAEVYAVLRDVERHPTWRKDLKKVELLPDVDGKRSFRETGSQGAITFVVDLDDPAAGRLITRIADDKLPFGGRWIIDVTPTATGSLVRVTEDGVVKNPLFRFLSRTVFSLTATQEKYLAALGRHLGADVSARPAEPASAA